MESSPDNQIIQRLRALLASKAFPLLFAVTFLSGCGVPQDTTVRADFLREHPAYTVLSVFVGEGDGAAAYFHIRYKRPRDPVVHETVWQYLDTGDSPWKLNHKSLVQ